MGTINTKQSYRYNGDNPVFVNDDNNANNVNTNVNHAADGTIESVAIPVLNVNVNNNVVEGANVAPIQSKYCQLY